MPIWTTKSLASSAVEAYPYNRVMKLLATALLFAATAVAEIVGCYLPYLWLRQGKSPWLTIPAILSLALFVWLLSLHPNAAGRVYAAYGGMYVTIALLWLWLVDGVSPDHWDYAGVALCLVGMGIIMFAPRGVDSATRTARPYSANHELADAQDLME